MSQAQITHRTVEILERLCHSAAQAVSGLAVNVVVWDDVEKLLVIRAFSGLQPLARGWPAGHGDLGRAWRKPESTFIPTLASLEPEVRAFATTAGADAVFIVPIAGAKGVQGMLLVLRRGFPGAASDDLRLLSIFAEQAANALGNVEVQATQPALAAASSAPAASKLAPKHARRPPPDVHQREVHPPPS
jgi:hypothetical protein